MTSPVLEGSYYADLLAQPEVLRAVRAKLDATPFDSALAAGLRTGRFRQVVLTGMGSSLHAAYPLHRALSRAGFVSHWVETAELLLGFEALYGAETLLIAVSQSGESAEVVGLMERAAEFGHVIGITNNEWSRLGRTTGTRLTLEAGPEATVSCKTYLATFAVLHWLRAQFTGGEALADLETAGRAVRGYLAHWRAYVAELLPLLAGIESIFVTGRGDSLATAGTGGLILKESTRRHAEGMSSAAFRHGPLEMAGASVVVLIFEDDDATAPLQRRLAEDIVRGGGKAVLIGTRASGVFRLPEVPDAVRPIVEILPVQMLSLALAARDGCDAGRFVRASKITNVA